MKSDKNLPEKFKNPPGDAFIFYVKKQPQGRIVTFEEREKLLLERLEKGDDKEDGLWEAARFYDVHRQPAKALEYLRKISSLVKSPKKKVACYLAMGLCMEGVEDFEKAVAFYSQAFSMKPKKTEDWYFINNNIGYSLNQLGKYKEAEKYCRAAIEIEPRRHNAHKNLGMAYFGQGDYPAAVKSLIAATRKNASDGRALASLDKLIEQHPEVTAQMPRLLATLQECRRAVELARMTRDSLNSG